MRVLGYLTLASVLLEMKNLLKIQIKTEVGDNESVHLKNREIEILELEYSNSY